MKCKRLLIMLLLALVVPWAAFGQEPSFLTVYDNDGTNTFVPIYGNWADAFTKTEFVMPAEDATNGLSDMNGGTITKMKFYIKSIGSAGTGWDHNTFQVFLKEIEGTTISAWQGTNDATIVYEGTLPNPAVGEYEITFTTGYEYNGGNLLVGIYNTTGNQNYKDATFYGKSVSGTSGSNYASSSSSLSNVNFTQRNFLPKTTFTYEAGSTPTSAPVVTTNQVATNITNVSATLGGNITSMGEGATSVYAGICYSTTSNPTTADAHVQSKLTSTGAYTQNITGLQPNTIYHFRAYAYNGYNSLEEPTYGDEYTFSTCGNITLNQPANGEISVSVAGGTATTSNTYAMEGQSVTLTATPAEGYNFDIWNVTGVTGTANGNTYTFTMPTNNVTATANFVPTPGGSNTITAWTETTSINTDNTYLIGAVSGNDVYLVLNYNPTTSSYYYSYSSNWWSFTAKATIDGNGYVTGCTGNATDLQYAQWNFSAETGGTITSNYESGKYLYGGTGSYTDLYPASSTTTWTYSNNKLSYSSSSYYLYLNPSHYVQRGTSSTASTVKLYTETEITTYAIVATANLLEGGSVAGSDYYANGASCTLTATPAFGYDFVNWTEGGEVVSTDPTYTFTVSGARTLVANFESQGSCIKPTGLAQVPNTLAAHQAQLGWTENNGATEWEVAYSTDNEFNPDNATSITVTENPATIPGLAQETTYYASVRAICGQGSQSGWSTKSAFETMSGHQAPTATYDLNTLTAHTVTVTWTGVATNVLHQSYDVYYSTIDETPTTQTPQYTGITATSKEIVGLDGGTTYYVWVRDNCGDDGYSDWSNKVPFTTEIACPAPTAFNVVPNSITGHTADLTWQGTSDSYVVSYRTAAYVDGTEETFDNNSIPTGWTRYTGLLSDVMGGTALTTTTSGWNFGTKNDVFNSSHSYINIWSTTIKYWLVSPQTEVPNGAVCSFDLALTKWSSLTPVDPTQQLDDKFVVLISTDNKATWTILRQWDNDDATTGDIYAVYNNIACSATGEFVSIDLSAYAGENVYIAFYGESTQSGGDNALHIDNVAIGTPVAAGEWQYKNVSEAPCELTGLLAERKYEATLQGDCGDEGPSTVVGPITFTTDIPCPAPTTLTKSNLKSTQVDLSWVNGGAENWVVAYKETSSNDDFIEISIGTNDVTIEGTLVTYPLTGLTPETPYTVKVRDNCEATVTGDGLSEWTDPMNFTTLAACALDNVTVSGITHHNATVTWDGESASGFTVSYRTAAGENALYSEDFEDETSFDNWTFTSMNEANGINGEGTYPAGICADAAHNSSLGFRFSSFDQKTDSETYDQYLVSPELTVTGTLKFYAYRRDAGDYLYVGYSTTTSDLDAFTWDDEALGFNSNQSWQEFTHELPTNVKYIAFHYFGNYRYYVYVDDIAITAPTPAGTTQTVVVTENTANLDELTAGQKYEVWVEPNCDVTLASEPQTFTTLLANNKYFLTAGDWATATNWMDAEMPAITDNAELRANATINNGTVAAAKKITINSGKTLTINDGGQLQTDNTVTATVKKNIEGYGDDGVNTNNGYYLIANPINTSYGSATSYGMVTSDGLYDLYQFNGNPSATDSLEWRNYKASSFYIVNGKGYLYANKNDVELTFTGTVRANNARVGLTTNNEGQWQFKAWNLLGNPFVCDAYMVDNDGNALAYYKMNEDGNGLVSIANGASIAPMEGVFFKNSGSGYINVYFTREEPAATDQLLNINLYQANTRSNSRIDNAIIRFGEGNTLEKFSFRKGSTNVYIPQDGKDYAVVNAGNVGEMPVSFKAAENGSYTLGFTNEEVTFSYLHLIDNLTGNDVDLLANPSYSFDARTTDYASRFRLVFATGSSVDGDNFGFVNGMGNLCIFGIEGTATLQVIDVTGRIISSETFSGSYEKNLNVAPGVYMLRLINGNDVKVQKMVVR